jgi:mannan endo-1,4-beta-mannosidase
MNHKNPYTGLTWANDPTIMAWETGNEFGAYMGKEGYPPASFTSSVADYIKSQTQALVIDGSDGFYNYR